MKKLMKKLELRWEWLRLKIAAYFQKKTIPYMRFCRTHIEIQKLTGVYNPNTYIAKKVNLYWQMIELYDSISKAFYNPSEEKV